MDLDSGITGEKISVRGAYLARSVSASIAEQMIWRHDILFF